MPASSDSGGRIIELSGSDASLGGDSMEGEALLVLPKLADGTVPTDFELAPDASIESSSWSPVLCATLVRVVGPPGKKPQELVPVVPKGALVVPNRRYHTSSAEGGASVGPDPYVPLQWGLAKTGVMVARPTWNGAGVRVALLDSAPDVTARDLARVRVLPLEDGPPTTPATHGSLLAGVIAAIEDNAFGIAGVASGAELLAIPVCAPVGASLGDECRMFDVLRGIDRAWQEDARVVNLALVGPPDPLLERAVDRLRAFGILVVAAAGNESGDAPRYPAAYGSVIGVGAADARGRRWPRSNRGPWVTLMAPGTEILSTAPGDAFAFGDGTSLAAAHVTGMLAVLLGGQAEPETVRSAFLEAARRAGARGGPAMLPKLCDVLPALGQHCPGPARPPSP